MPETTDFRAETTVSMPEQDPLADALRSLCVRGSLLLCEEYSPPWAIDVPGASELARLFGLDNDDRVVPFHLVRRGHFELRSRSRAPRVVEAGEVVMCPGGQAHRLSQGRVQNALPLAKVLSRPRRVALGSASLAAPTALVCGVFFLRDVRLNPLFNALPEVLHIATDGASADHVTRGVAALLLSEVSAPRRGGAFVVERLLELLCAEAIAAHASRVEEPSPSWFSGVADPSVGHALAAIHAAPGDPWSVRTLARCASLSPSRFAARFRDLLGESPMTYVTKWRMCVARRLIRAGDRSIASIAADAGYESVPAFTRTFKKLWGAPPSTFRAR